MSQCTPIKIAFLSTVLKYPGPDESAGRVFLKKFVVRAGFTLSLHTVSCDNRAQLRLFLANRL
jgi:hypothetical protein